MPRSLLQYCCRRLDSQKARIGIMDDIEYAGRASFQKQTSVEEDNSSAKAQYHQDMMANALRRAKLKKSDTVELTRERFPEES